MFENKFDNLEEETAEAEETTNEKTEETTPEEETTETETQEQAIPDKFREKTKEDVVKSYSELEKKLTEQAQKIAELEKGGMSKEEIKEARKDLSQIEKEITDEIDKADYSKMQPQEYGKFLINKVKRMTEAIAEQKASDTYSKESSFREKIRTEVSSVSRKYPILQEKSERGQAFREIVLDIVSAAKARGQEIPLAKAVERASMLTGTGEQTEPKKDVKKPKPLEKAQLQTPGENTSEEDIMKERIKRAGGGGVLGGL
jgi:hypothetical protein